MQVSGRTLGVYYEAVQASQFKLNRKRLEPAFVRAKFVPRALFASEDGDAVHPLKPDSLTVAAIPPVAEASVLGSSHSLSSDDDLSDDVDSSSSNSDEDSPVDATVPPVAPSMSSDLTISAAACVLLSSCASAASPCALSSGCVALDRPHVLSSPVKVA